jgi:hypothetical protein
LRNWFRYKSSKSRGWLTKLSHSAMW